MIVLEILTALGLVMDFIFSHEMQTCFHRDSELSNIKISSIVHIGIGKK